MLFSVVAEKEHDLIGFLAVYKTGCQRIAMENEVFISSFLIDKKYRNAYYTLYDMFLFAVEEIIKRGYTIISSEVTYDNTLSLHILKKVGFVLLDNVPDIYNNFVLHNYVYGMTRLLEIDSNKDKSTLLKLLPYVKRKELLKTNDTISKKLVWQTYILPCGLSNVLFEINSGNPVGIEITNKFKCIPNMKSSCCYMLYNLSNETQNIHISSEEYRITITLEAHTRKQIEIPTQYKRLKILLKNLNYKFNLDVMKSYNNIDSIKKLNNSFKIDYKTGVLSIINKNLKLREIWPSLTSPYLTAGIIPNSFAKSDYYQINSNEFALIEKRNNIVIKRIYLYNEDCILISTYYNSLAPIKIDPFYQIVLDDLNYTCEFKLNDKMLYSTKYDSKDRNSYTEEIMFENFKHNGNAFNDVEAIIKYNDIKYNIIFPKNTKIFLNCNCIVVRQNINATKPNDDFIHLGNIVIKYKEEISDENT